MAYEGNDTIKRLFQRFFRDELPNLTPDERAAFEAQFEGRLDDLLTSSASPEPPKFADLIGFGPGPVKPFDQLAYLLLKTTSTSRSSKARFTPPPSCISTSIFASSADPARAGCISWRNGGRSVTRSASG